MKRGTSVWGLNKFRSTVLPAIISDLEKRESIGLLDVECTLVQNSLNNVVETIDKTADGGFLKSLIYNEMNEFKKIYIEWNGPNNSDPDCKPKRIKSLAKLKKQKDAIIRKIRENQSELVNEKLDKILVKSFYQSFDNLTDQLPEIFSNVSQAINKFNKKDTKYNKAS